MTSLGKLASQLGAIPQRDNRTRFLVWAPKFDRVDLHVLAPRDVLVPMERLDRGYWAVEVDSAPPGARYVYRFDDEREWPDPASRSQPDGVHGASEVIDPAEFDWKQPVWRAPSIEDYVIYEVHIGTFTPEGTFDAAIGQLDRLAQLGITALEIMPVAEFPGCRNWGYDGAYPYAAQSTYGGPRGLAKLVDACHQRGIAVVLDVVYNHFGPEGAYAAAIGNYLTDRYHTPWGDAMNFDGPGSDEVRRFFIESALYWLRDLHVDAFRLDAVHAIFDQSAYPFLRQFTREIHRAAREMGRVANLIAESDLNDPRMIQTPEIGGIGFDAQWSDDLHHAIHARLTGESNGYYRDFGSIDDIRRALQSGFTYTGQYSAHRDRSHGFEPALVHPFQFVVCSQNHDQVGNRANGERLTAYLDLEQLKLAAATVILSPFTPMLFMGEEYGEAAHFQYFTSHGDPALIEAVRTGRATEFRSFGWSAYVPDPHDPEIFERSKLNVEQRSHEPGKFLDAFYHELIRLRRETPALHGADFSNIEVDQMGEDGSIVVTRRSNGEDQALIVLNFADSNQVIEIPPSGRSWQVVVSSANESWGGPGGPTAKGDRVRGGAPMTISPSSATLLVAESSSR